MSTTTIATDMYESFMTKFIDGCSVEASEIVQMRKMVNDIWQQIGLFDHLNSQYKAVPTDKIPLKVHSHQTVSVATTSGKPKNSWIVFRVARYKELKDSGVDPTTALKQCSVEWKEKSQTEKDVYKSPSPDVVSSNGAPKVGAKPRKTSGYNLFITHTFKISKEYNTVTSLPAVAKLWKELPENERKEWVDKALEVDAST